MMPIRRAPVPDLFSDPSDPVSTHEVIDDGAVILWQFAATETTILINELRAVLQVAPFRHMVTPGGHTMSVAMSNCGTLGCVTDRTGYRYQSIAPDTNKTWPPMPDSFLRLAVRAAAAAGYDNFAPNACLINCYQSDAQLTLHQDKNERNFAAPIVSVSIGLPALFLFGGLTRSAKVQRCWLTSGDVVVWGGASRLAFHGVAKLADGRDPLTGRCRINLTFRTVA